jgi:integrase
MRPEGFPLFAHGCGQWAKKVGGRTRYFGPWRDAAAALKRWLAEKDDLLAGREPRPLGPEELTVRELCNDFLTSANARIAAGELGQRGFAEYLAACRRFVRVCGRDAAVGRLVPGDFERLKADIQAQWGPVRTGNEIQRLRSICRHAVTHGLITTPVLFGSGFAKPSRTVLRKHRAAKGAKMFEAWQIRDMLKKAGPTLRAMILLGINCGLGNHDCAALKRPRRRKSDQRPGELDLKTGWLDYPRPKTGVPRRAWLWPETVTAIRLVLRRRKAASSSKTQDPRPKTQEKLLFRTKGGQSWHAKPTGGNPISGEIFALLKRLKLWRAGLGFYALRHTFETIAGESKDQVAVDYVMGHAPDSRDMAAVYRERISDERIKAVCERVRTWLWPETAADQVGAKNSYWNGPAPELPRASTT